jgi:uncharacterized protein (TIGR00369 family)
MTDFIAQDPNFQVRIEKSFHAQGLMGHLGAGLVSVSPGTCEIELPFSDAVSQQHGFFHGGVIGTIADTAGGYAAFTLMDADDGILTVEYKINMMAPASGELLIGRGQVLRSGRTLTVSQAEVSVVKDGKETVCAAMQQTLMRIVGRADVFG